MVSLDKPDGKVNDEVARIDAFRKFIRSLPRTCSPTVFNTIGCPSPGFSKDADCAEEWNSKEFNWSIEQIAVLNPTDISCDEHFNDLLTNLMDSSLDRQNEEFFTEDQILPSPAYCRSTFTPGDATGSFLTPLTWLPPEDCSTPYQPCTPPPTRSATRTASISSLSSSTPYGYKTKNKKKLFNDNQD